MEFDEQNLATSQHRLVPAVLGAMNVLNFVAARGPVRGNRVQAASGLNVSTCHSILKTLVHGGYLEFNRDAKEYSLGPVMAALGTKARTTDAIAQLARPLMRRWVESTQFTIFLAKPLPDRTFVVVDKVESTQGIKMTVEVGQRFPLSAAALGKAYMAFLPEPELKETLDGMEFPEHTPNSIRDRSMWTAELDNVRVRGWAESRGEYYASTNAVTAPIVDATREVVLVVGSLASATDLPIEALAGYGARIRDLADEITLLLASA